AVGRGLGERIVVDRERLRQSQSAFHKLVKQFPHALPKIVGDVAAWSERVSSVLECLKRAVHGGDGVLTMNAAPWKTVPRSERERLERLLQRQPPFQEAVRAILWSGAVWHEPREALLDQLIAFADPLGQHLICEPNDEGLTTALLLIDLAWLDGDEAAAFALSILGNESRRTVATSGYSGQVAEFVANLKKWRDRTSPPEKPQRDEGTWGGEAVQFVRWLAAQKRSIRQRAVRLVNLLPIGPILDEWQAAWDAFFAKSHRAIRDLCDFGKHADRDSFHSEANRVACVLEGELNVPPDSLVPVVVLSDVRQISELASDSLHDVLCRFLAIVPVEESPCLTARRGRMLRLVTLREISIQVDEKHWERSLVWYLTHAEQFFQRHGHQPWCARPWNGVIDSWSGSSYIWQSPRATLQSSLDDAKQWPVFFEALGRLAAHPGYRFHLNDQIAWLTGIAPDLDVVCNRYHALADAELLEDLSQPRLSAAAALETEGFPFAELCTLVGPVFEEAREVSGAFESLALSFASAGWPSLLPSLLKQKRTTEVARMASQCAAVGSTVEWPRPAPRPSAARLPVWAERLPREWHSVIAEFCEVSPDARRTIERILSEVCPSRERLDHEIAALEQLVTRSTVEPHLVTRLANLLKRRDHPRPVAQEALARCRRKLEEALLRFVFDDVQRRLDAALIGLLTEQTGSQRLARQISSPRHLELVRAILRVHEPFRTFGLRLLKQRWGGVEWNLEAEPANHRFVAELTARGIRFAPWRSSAPLRVATDAKGRPITMRFERDEVEKLLMGYHFDTCLSTDGCNFFSAVANAVDENKQVLYARDGRDRVVGRCLFALGDAGSIMTFNPYCHDAEFPFAEHVAAIAAELAANMNTFVSRSDHVSSLVAPDWYNDGALDLGVSFDREDSPVRRAIAAATEETLVASLAQALDPVGLTDTALALVVELSELEARPQLVRPLLPMLERYESQLSPSTLVAAAFLAHKASLHEYAARIVVKRLQDWLVREVRRHGVASYSANRALEMLIEYQPASALNVLRQTRPRQVRSDDDESQDERLLSLSRCYERLGRSNLAASLRHRRQQNS
ncbi:MAG: hypothetical protein H7062_16565, partial [Candidatus Saccharimonas sp.]|nr:hypothetical protein [Planctomycetaceae bacterium]